MRMQGIPTKLKNGVEVTIKSAAVGEVGKLLKFMRAVYSKSEFLDMNANEVAAIKKRWMRKEIKQYEKSKRQIMIVATYEGEIVAYCLVGKVSNKDKESHRAKLSIAVVKEMRGIGLGSKMMRLAIDFASKVAYEQFEVDLVAGNTEAFILYKEYGFEALGKFPRAYKNIKGFYTDTILMIKYLNLV